MDSKDLNLIKIWVRNDDVSRCDDKYCQIIQVYKKYDVFTVLCAIPTIIEKECFDLVKNYDNFVLSQHGYSHKNYGKLYSSRYSIELSDDRDINEVISQMLEGKNKLESISQMPVNILTPPYNRIDKDVEKKLSEYYMTLSVFGDYKSSFKRDFNPCIDVIDWKSRSLDKKHFELKLEEKMKSLNEIGICIHHNFLATEDILYLDEVFNTLSKDKRVVLSRRLL